MLQKLLAPASEEDVPMLEEAPGPILWAEQQELPTQMQPV